MTKPKLLMIVPQKWAGLASSPLEGIDVVMEGKEPYDPATIDYVLSFTPPPGLIAKLTRLKAAFSLGAGVDGVLSDPTYPKHIPLVRFVDRTLSAEMAQYVLMQILMHHRLQRFFDAAQREGVWKQRTLPRLTEHARVGFLGLGEIGSFAARQVAALNFPVSSWTRSRKTLPGVKSFAGDGELKEFLSQADFLVCLLSLTRRTVGILNAKTFAMLPKGAFVINVARGAHLNEADLLAALDSGHLSGAALDVFDTEPLPKTSGLWHHANVTVTPHVAAISQPEVVLRFVRDGIAHFERGERPDNIVDVETAY